MNEYDFKIRYTNHRGETRVRTIMPERFLFGSTQWHPEPQWLLRAFDCEKQAHRDFAWRDIKLIAEPPTSWHARFIAEQCGDMARWRRVGLAAYLEDAETEYGGPLPIPELLIAEEFSDCTVVTMQWTSVSRVVTLYFGLRGFTVKDSPSRDPAQLAAALKELYKGEG